MHLEKKNNSPTHVLLLTTCELFNDFQGVEGISAKLSNAKHKLSLAELLNLI